MKNLLKRTKGQTSLFNFDLKMKLSALLLLTGLFALHANEGYSQRTKVTLDMNNITIERFIDEIEDKTEFRFFYLLEDVDLKRTVSVKAKREKVNSVLDRVFAGTKTTYQIDDRQISLVKRIQSETKVKEQAQKAVQGKVNDENGTPLPGANILEKGTTNGTQTDFDGNFTINVADENATLVVSYLGFTTKEIALNGQTSVEVSLAEDSAKLDEVVIIGYGSVKKSDLTGAVSSIRGDKLNTDSQASVDQIIQGRIPGVQVTQSSAEPGGNFSIRIRGTNSITAGNEPLYVIDGLPGANPGNSLNPSDIQSIEVLKDASATAIYGARGSNGVILITTKKGRKDTKLEINYNTSIAFQSAAKKLDLMNAQEYMSFYNDVHVDRGNEPPFSQEDIVAIGRGTNWQDEILRSAPIYEHRLSLSGGSSDTQYYLSLNYFDQDGIVINSGFKRLSGRLNLTHSIGEKLKVGFNLNTSSEQENLIPLGLGVNAEAGTIATSLQLPPTLPVFDENGNFSISLQDLSNSVAQAKTIDELVKTTRVYGNAFVEYELIKDLKTKINVGYDQSLLRGDLFMDTQTQRGVLDEGRATRNFEESSSYLFEFTADYNLAFDDGKHKVNLLGGYSFQEFENSDFFAAAQNFPTNSFGSNNLGAGDPTKFDVGSFKSENTIVSGFGRINYNFDDRYLLSGSFRADGSSRFGENNKFAYFPSGAIAWNISNESFYPETSLISNLKLRASYGESGNQEIANGRSLTLLGSGPIAVLDGTEFQSIAPIQLANPNLKWETTQSFNAGIDFGLFDGRISGTIEYFRNNTRDLLLLLPIPTTSGFSNSLQNVGDTRNSGFEFNITSRNFQGENFSWTTDLNFATLKNEVTNLGELPRILQGEERFMTEFTLLEVGKPINSYYGYVFDGVFQNQQEVDTSPSQANAAPGSRKFRDINGDGAIDVEDRTVLGDPFPDITLGLNNSLNYKGFTFDFFLEGKFGFELANFTNLDSENPIDDLRNRQRYVLNRWTPENPTNEHPSFVNPSRTFDFNSRVVEDASFLRLRSAKLAYSFPNLNIKGVKALSIYTSGQNLFTITDYRGYNPDVNSLGSSNVRIDYSAYPLARIYSLGINVTF
ncbi:TonB-dependent receptor [Muricauda oceani]|uniref:TonB-dependent receptor n=1 Tax=Flagellimonas oceani TaxID=2698672 RepID=A0A6G7J072_9FLAO|nr:TonB-dependent receptor [Allomuricauda oceani]MBW8244848.1 TonB-dependent receptor [Allomuricauda oceani]QII43842.1 TonB-dependent receptor [Allomuricauda oceani]